MSTIRSPRLVAAAALLIVATAAAALEAHPPRAAATQAALPPIHERVSIRIDADARAALPRHAVTARVHRSTLHCEGVALIDLLRAGDAIPDGALRSRHLARAVLVQARDGYRAAFSLAELDPGTGAREVFVVDRCGDAALDERDGPLRLLVPGDVRAARSVRQVESIDVLALP